MNIREQMIEWLIDQEIDFLETEGRKELADILFRGFDGFSKWTDEELRREILDRDPDNMTGHNLTGEMKEMI